MYWTILIWCARIVLGLVCLASALGKSLDLSGFVEVLSTYRLFPDQGLWPIALLIIGSEWGLAVWLLSGWNIESGALVALFLYGLYGAGLGITLLRGIDLPNCGCYGVFSPNPCAGTRRWKTWYWLACVMRYGGQEKRPRSC